MNGTRKQYPKAKDGLPKTAITVKMYANKIGHSVCAVYKMYDRGLVNIVEFCGINFVLGEKLAK
jgi:hypothetical protein